MEEKNKEVMINSDMKSSSEIHENEYRKSAEESMDVFAQGLPEWSIEPPQVIVRRRKI